MLQNLCWLPIKIKSKYFPYIYLIIFGLLFQSEFCALLGGFLAGMLYSTGMLKFTDPSRTCIAKVNSTILRPFVNYPSFAKEYDGVGFHVIAPSQHNIPASGDPQANNNRSAQPVSAFAGRGVVVGTERLINQPPAETANAIQYIREAWRIPEFSSGIAALRRRNPDKKMVSGSIPHQGSLLRTSQLAVEFPILIRWIRETVKN